MPIELIRVFQLKPGFPSRYQRHKRELFLIHLLTCSQLGPQVCRSIAQTEKVNVTAGCSVKGEVIVYHMDLNLQTASTVRGSVTAFTGRLATGMLGAS